MPLESATVPAAVSSVKRTAFMPLNIWEGAVQGISQKTCQNTPVMPAFGS
jgi:hypothetical protein